MCLGKRTACPTLAQNLATDSDLGDSFQHHQVLIFIRVTMQRRCIAGLRGDLDGGIDAAGLSGGHT